ncbi:VOC family protein [Devosia submarina]|jgi:glyoxylase I family protein|uniref:VOC family protein n=1 Tax=Devosia submarina TaxID=1173082 RepID=UPI000D3AC802|nr:VOC family protein [Devosia submarina]
MLKGFEHVGITVKNIDKSLAFYVDLLGLKLLVRRPGQNGDEMAFLDAKGPMIEMICPATGALTAEDVAVGRAGVRHLTFNFESVDETYRKLLDAGVDMVEPPRDAHNRDIARRLAFCRDPDGIMIELIER